VWATQPDSVKKKKNEEAEKQKRRRGRGEVGKEDRRRRRRGERKSLRRNQFCGDSCGEWMEGLWPVPRGPRMGFSGSLDTTSQRADGVGGWAAW
jgi:hypothetical protein